MFLRYLRDTYEAEAKKESGKERRKIFKALVSKQTQVTG